MKETIFYIENSNALDTILKKISDTFDCQIDREYIEMNFSRIVIQASEETMKTIECILTLFD